MSMEEGLITMFRKRKELRTRHHRIVVALSVAVLAITAAGYTMQNTRVVQGKNEEEQEWITRLKNTSMSQVDAGLPAETFAEWFSRHRKGSDIYYEIETCDDVDSKTPYAGKGPLKCVTAVSTQGVGSELVLRFVAAAPGKDGKFQSVESMFLSGSEGPPPNSPMKRMTRVLRKLSDLHWD
jgi:hypothetical protein